MCTIENSYALIFCVKYFKKTITKKIKITEKFSFKESNLPNK